MTGNLLTPRRTPLLLAALGLWALGPGCFDDSSVSSGPRRRPLLFVYFVHPGSIDAASPAPLRAGVLVGPSACWSVTHATIDRHGNELRIYGSSQLLASRVCATAIAYDTLSLVIPPLEPGTYLLTAGSLVDTLLVHSPAPRPAGEHFAAIGDICQSDRGCVLFRCEHPNAQEVEGVVTRGLPDGPSPGGTCRLAVTGTVAGRETCSGVERNAIEIRGYAWRAP